MENIIFLGHPALTTSISRGEHRLISKSYDLFDKRGIVGLAQSWLAPDEYGEWIERALALQVSIYGLDLYYEGRATLRHAEEGALWERIERELNGGRRDNDDLLWESYADLRLYADVETRIHQFDRIDPREFPSIARLKCADVRMARGLIWTLGGHAHPKVLRYWELYDQCWELIEDVLDIGEDGTDWNFNFWLYSFMAGGRAEEGVFAARAALWRKMAELDDSYRRLPSDVSRAVADSFNSTLAAATVSRRCWPRVLSAITKGRVLRFGEQIGIAARAA
jgi:hypothetical protein